MEDGCPKSMHAPGSSSWVDGCWKMTVDGCWTFRFGQFVELTERHDDSEVLM